jgi:putative ABC transport system substrate-binding protein
VIALTRVLGAALIALFTSPLEAQPARTHRIGFLSPVSATSHAAPVAAFLQGLREAGYQEGANLRIEYRWAEERTDRLPVLAVNI